MDREETQTLVLYKQTHRQTLKMYFCAVELQTYFFFFDDYYADSESEKWSKKFEDKKKEKVNTCATILLPADFLNHDYCE